MSRHASSGRHRRRAEHRRGRTTGRAAPAQRAAGAHRAAPDPTGERLAGSAAVGALVAGCALVGSALAPQPAASTRAVAVAPAADASTASLAGVAAAPGAATSAVALAAAGSTAAAPPVSVSIPALGVDAPLVPLGVQADGALEVPADASQAGWFTGGATPGSPGPAVLAGHVDSAQGPGVFIALDDLVSGDEVLVDREDGSRVRFVVTRALRAPKDAFPTQEVYGPTTAPELRLITCGGPFDRSTGHYEDNLVVFATLAA